jgi:hypothetical protein
MKPTDITRYLKTVLPTGRPVFVWGSPGIGKSSVVHKCVSELFPAGDGKVWELRATEFEGVDLRGVPTIRDGFTHWAPPDIFPTASDAKGVLFLDELPQAEADCQKVLAKLALDRMVGDLKLPKEVYIVAAGNRAGDRAGVGRVLTHLLNRFAHVDFDVDLDDWCAWAVANDIDTDVISFIRWKGTPYLSDFRPESGERAFSSPRAWAIASDVLRTCPEDLLTEALGGIVSPGKAAEVIAHRALRAKLPDIDDILAHPTTADVPRREASVIYSLIGALADRVNKNPKLAKAYVVYARRLPDEFGVVAAKQLPPKAMASVIADAPAVWNQWMAELKKKGYMA